MSGEERPILTPEEILERVKVHFPVAKLSTEVVAAVNKKLKESKCTAENTLYGQSLCADEINHESGDISTLFVKEWKEVFFLVLCLRDLPQ